MWSKFWKQHYWLRIMCCKCSGCVSLILFTVCAPQMRLCFTKEVCWDCICVAQMKSSSHIRGCEHILLRVNKVTSTFSEVAKLTKGYRHLTDWLTAAGHFVCASLIQYYATNQTTDVEHWFLTRGPKLIFPGAAEWLKYLNNNDLLLI